MAYRNDNLAYDLSVYEPKAKPVPVQQPKPKIEVKRNTAAVNVSRQSAAGIFMTAAAVIAVMFALLYGKVETNRLFGEITQLENELMAIESDNVALAAEYESKTSLKSVEDYAQNVLGLQKLDKAQIEYVELPGNTVLEVVEGEKQNIFVIIRNWFDSLCEYLGA